MTSGLVTIKSASEILRVSISTLRNWDKNGKLKSVRDKNSGYRMYSISALEKFAKSKGMKLERPKRRLVS